MASAAITIWNTSHPLHPDKPWYEIFSGEKSLCRLMHRYRLWNKRPRVLRAGESGPSASEVDDFEHLFHSRHSTLFRTSAVRKKAVPMFGVQKGAQL